MRNAARITLAVVLALGGLALLPGSSSLLSVTDASAQLPQPTPTLCDLLPCPTPSPSPSESGGGSGGGGGGSGGGGSGGGSQDGKKDGSGGDAKEREDGKAGAKSGRGGKRSRGGGKAQLPVFKGTYRPGNSFDTDRLVAIAAHLRSLGWSQEQITSEVYPPFIVAGEAAWTNTWGVPRYGPAPGQIRTHEGQDVFCNFGDPVLASEAGTIQFDNGGLGGRVARLFRPDGSYWYYAHLSDWNTDEFSNGDLVRPGDVIAYCGNSGNAITTPPHIHFGWYVDGRAKNSQRTLVGWLREAQSHALDLVSETQAQRVRQHDRLTAARRFGDDLVPVVSELSVPSEALLAAGSNPASGAFGLATSALQAALAEEPAADGSVPIDVSLEGTFDGDAALLDPDSELARLLAGSANGFETGD
ncbi:MAG: M23 family metallopeptidase [Actinomycetota bacterium]